jgi:diguanylate cyclase (GGDEF)-like protein
MFLAMCAVTTYTIAVLVGELLTGAELEDELRAQALRDSLTGLANRRLLFDRIEHASRRLARRQGMVALLFIDLDAFKAVNDVHGHATGDQVLVQAADRLRDVVRDHDSVARLGGDEFLILAEDLHDAADAHALAARVVAVFDAPFETRSGPIRVSASVGIATTTVPILDPAAYLGGADRAMYTAKRAGGHRLATA